MDGDVAAVLDTDRGRDPPRALNPSEEVAGSGDGGLVRTVPGMTSVTIFVAQGLLASRLDVA